MQVAEKERKGHQQHIAALEEAQRARDSREDFLRSEVDRLSNMVQELEETLEDERNEHRRVAALPLLCPYSHLRLFFSLLSHLPLLPPHPQARARGDGQA